VPLILTLLSENKRQRLAANVALKNWPLTPGSPRPAFSNLPELTRLAGQSRRPAAPVGKPGQSKREELEERYLRLEAEVSKHRYP
jgi:hypothetical protein